MSTNTWKSLDPWSIYVPNAELEEWVQGHRARIVDELAGLEGKGGPQIAKAIEPLSNSSIHAENVRAFARILSAKASARDAKIDRQLAKRTDALGDLYRSAPKTTRKAA